MSLQTTDHSQPRQEGCSCTPFVLCAECYGRLERFRAEKALRDWLRMWDANGSGPR